MTKQELIELSKRVAEKLGINSKSGYTPLLMWSEFLWLHEDSKRCFELMCEYRLEAKIGGAIVSIFGGNFLGKRECLYDEIINHFNNDRALTTRVAILKALEAL